MRHTGKLIAAGVCLIVLAARLTSASDPALQELVSPTPARITIASPTPILTEASAATATWTPTVTAIGALLLEAQNEANVRSGPDINAEKLGTIRAGETYVIIGRSFRWIQFQYDISPSGTGWVYDELVNIIGNPDDIVDLNANILPTVDTSIVNATQTWEAITQTPGGVLTATADARIIQAPGVVTSDAIDGGSINGSDSNNAVLPTFTYPPGIAPQAPTQAVGAVSTITPESNTLVEAASNGIAPIVPILAFGGLGILGLTITSMRRKR
jgi:hypothetical protein